MSEKLFAMYSEAKTLSKSWHFAIGLADYINPPDACQTVNPDYSG
jgi:hypothetical protein